METLNVGLNVGMYIRTKDGIIDKVIIDYNGHCASPNCECKHISCAKNYYDEDEIVNASYDIMDLIKVEDYVNGYKVSLKGYDYAHFVQCDYPVENGTTNHYKFYKQAIKSVVTKELFELAEYRIGE